MNFNITIEEKECVALYAFLKKREETLGPELEKLLRRVETVVFEHLSIEDAEALTLSGGEKNMGGTA